MHTLYFNEHDIVLNIGGQSHRLPLTLNDICQTLSPFPPSESQWEQAIMLIEDSIAPWRDDLANDRQTRLVGANELTHLPHQQHDNDKVITADTLEHAFAVLAGWRLARELPDLPHTVELATKILLMREWVHHLAIDELVLIA